MQIGHQRILSGFSAKQMASNEQSSDTSHGAGGAQSPEPDQSTPDWAGGLRQLYDSVVEEPIPDAFKDLLDRLDDSGTPQAGGESSPAGDGEG